MGKEQDIADLFMSNQDKVKANLWKNLKHIWFIIIEVVFLAWLYNWVLGHYGIGRVIIGMGIMFYITLNEFFRHMENKAKGE